MPTERSEGDAAKEAGTGALVPAPRVVPVPWHRRLWHGLHSRFARQIAAATVVVGAIAAAGHFIGGMIGWWHAYEITLGAHPGSSRSESAKAPAGRTDAQSMVLLPLVDESESRDGDWFADVLTSDLTVEIGRLPGALVISRDTARTYRGKTADPRGVARDLGVRYVISGSVRRQGERIRLDLAMIDGDNGLQVWTQRFELDRSRLAGELGDIVLQLARSLNVQTYRSSGEKVTALKPGEVKADDLAMQGWAVHFRGFTPENIRDAHRLFEEAVQQDPRSTRGWGGVAFTSGVGVGLGWLPDRDAAMRRLEQATEALRQLDESSFFALLSKQTLANRKGDWASTLTSSAALLERFPSHAPSLGNRAQALMGLGRFDECLEPVELALRIGPRDPLVGVWRGLLAICHFMRADYREAAEVARVAWQSNPKLPLPPLVLAASLQRDGRTEEARQIVTDYLARNAGYEASNIERPMPGTEPRLVEGRQRLIDSLRALGMP